MPFHRKINDTKLLEMMEQGKTTKELADYFKVSDTAIKKRKRKLKAYQGVIPESVRKLTPKKKAFVLAHALEGKTKTEACLASHDCKNREVAKALGSKLSHEPDIQTALADLKKSMTSIMIEEGFSTRGRIRRLRDIADSTNQADALKALDMSFKLDNSYAPDKIIFMDNRSLAMEAMGKLEAIDRLLKTCTVEGIDPEKVIDGEA
jgi:hypothetical protein